MKKRGQMDQIFVYIFLVVVAGLILIFGYRGIQQVIHTGEDVEFVKFLTEFRKETDKYYYLAEGSMKKVSLRVGFGIKEVCFVGEDRDFDYEDEEVNALMKTLKDKNMFFVMKKGKEKIGAQKIEHLKPAGNLLCIKPLLGNLNFKLTTMQDFVEINDV